MSNTADLSNTTDPSHGFKITSVLEREPNSPFISTQCCVFPWGVEAVETLFARTIPNEQRPLLRQLLSKWSDATVTAGSECVNGKDVPSITIVSALSHSFDPIVCRIEGETNQSTTVGAVAWALLTSKPPTPLVLIAAGRNVYLLNPENRKVIGSLRGHGGNIRCIAVHPNSPQTFVTTSDDTSMRLYDLSLSPRDGPVNPHWPPSTTHSHGGAAFGLQASGHEGFGTHGRCVAVYAGGRPGGHNAAVLGACFNPYYPVIATCGMDRHIKIWKIPRLRDDEPDAMIRECRPIFSTSRIHEGSVISVAWKNKDTLVTHSAPCLWRCLNKEDDSYRYEYREGTLALWKWTGADRFFPPDHEPWPQEQSRGCLSDYEESSSNTILSKYRVPHTSPARHKGSPETKLTDFKPIFLTIYLVPGSGSCIVAYIYQNAIHLLNVDEFEDAHPPPFPHAYRPTLGDSAAPIALDSDEEEQLPKSIVEEAKPLSRLPVGWRLPLDKGCTWGLKACSMGLYGGFMVGTGENGNFATWTVKAM